MATQNRKVQRWAPVILVVLLLGLLFAVNRFTNAELPEENGKTEVVAKGLNRSPSRIEYSRHARCRMECRKINEQEVEQILKEGKINYRKSEIGQLPDCKRKYAVEGVTYEGQKVRIIFAPCETLVTVVTVIDIGRDWPCNCD
jgi:hypothetical protein